MNRSLLRNDDASGKYPTSAEERYCAIRNVDPIALFLISLVSTFHHWLFISSTRGPPEARLVSLAKSTC